LREVYTSYPRPVLWLVPEGTVQAATGEVAVAPFYLSTLPVTNRQFEAFDPTYVRSSLAGGDDDPAVRVSFRDALAYCAWYSRVSRKPMRLPTEVEWERAAEPARWRQDPAAERYVWHSGNSEEVVPRIEGRRANELGIYGMLGGVWEWVVAEEGRGVLRGGSWRSSLAEVLAGARRSGDERERPADAGFRIAKSLRW
jgi:formylglycine-generating enzyme required for sulfatase activity